MPELRFTITQQQKSSLRRLNLALGIWSIDSGISYTGSIDQTITDPSICSNAGSTLL